MKRVPALLCTLLAAVAALAAAPSSEAQIASGKITTLDASSFDFAEPVERCIEYCVELVGVRQQLDCAGYFLPPLEGCDLPWIDSHRPTGAPFGQEEWCVPKKLDFGGYHLSEDVDRVRRTVIHTGDCTTEIHDVELQQLAPLGNSTRLCPGPGAWSESNFTLESIRFVGCP